MRTKKLFEIVPDDSDVEVRGSVELEVAGIEIDSRKVSESFLFIAIQGRVSDGHLFIEKAIENGAAAILCQQWPVDLREGVTYVKVSSTQMIAGLVASSFYDHPSERLRLIGVTGTNGKTTIATLLHQLYSEMGYFTGLVSTVENKIGQEVVPATHTTPDPIRLNELLSIMVDRGCEYAFMEVSSHAIDQGRIAGLDFEIAIFSNLTHDHLDYHGSFKEYAWTKKKLFDHLAPSSIAITNVDDKNGGLMVQNTKAQVRTYGLRRMSDYKCKVISDSVGGLQLMIDRQEVHFKLSGRFNAYNIMAVLACAVELGASKDQVLLSLSALNGPEGRLEKVIVKGSKKVGFVDYAHTPDALENVLKTLDKVRSKDAKIVVVVGAGGDRDKAKRPLMAQVACKWADQVVLTSDNPRSENPEVILNEMEKGVAVEHKRKSLRITNRKEAIRTAVRLAKDIDLVLVAGKGHEKYQEIKGEKLPFDDKQVLMDALNEDASLDT